MSIVISISLVILALHNAFSAGNILSPVRVWGANRLDTLLGMKWSRYVQKPLWDCLPCMASFWGLPLAFLLVGGWASLIVAVAVSGLNVLISRTLFIDDVADIPPGPMPHGYATEYGDDIPTLRTKTVEHHRV